MWDRIVSVPDHCLSFYLANPYKCLAITTNALPLIRIACDGLRNCCESNENMLSWRILGTCS